MRRLEKKSKNPSGNEGELERVRFFGKERELERVREFEERAI